MEKVKKYIELHAHLDGSVTFDMAKKLAKIQNISLSGDEREIKKRLSVSGECKSLNQFLECFSLPLSLLQTKESLEEAAFMVLENMEKDNIIYAELRFAPQLHTSQGMSCEEAVKAVLKGMKRGNILSNLILCCMRGSSKEKNLETLFTAKKYLTDDGGVTGLDLAGAEALYPTKDYEDIFREAKKLNIPFTIHAGEASGAGEVRKAVEMGASRIGHGVRIENDREVMNLVLEKGICLEMCPTSNILTKAIENIKDYPLIKFLDMGIKATLNTDDMAIAGTTLPREYELMEKTLGLTYEHEKILAENAVDSAFASKETKAVLRKILEKYYKNTDNY